jgi:WD40 repeat protein
MNSSPNKAGSRCSRCGKPLVVTRLEGVCPACLWTDIFSEPVHAESADAPGANPVAPIGLVPIPGHEVREEIARGGMGIVYRARQLEPSRTVALKMLLPHQSRSEQMRARFRIEIQAVTGLEHPAILPVYQVGEQDGLPWFTMKLAGGGSLVSRRAAFAGNWRAIAELVATLADAVQFAHERGVLHRDLKPGNILFDEAGRPFVSDFGLAKVIGTDSDLTRSVDFLGTPHYAAPEVAAGSARHATTASDLYSLGAILYELLAGRPPFEAEGIPALLRKIAEEEPPLPSEFCRSRREEALTSQPQADPGFLTAAPAKLPRDLEVICLKCLAKEPARRYAAARDLADDLRRWLDGRPILARPARRLERVQSWARRNPALATVSGLLVAALALGGLGLWERNRKLERALLETQRAQAEAQANLRQSLIAQARALRQSGRAGRRGEALKATAAATKIQPGLDARNEAAAALATTDIEFLRSLPRYYANALSTVDFAPEFDSYLSGSTNGFVLRSAEDGRVLREFPAPDGSPGHQPRFSPDGNWFFGVHASGVAEVWSLDAPQPAWHRQPATGQRAVGAIRSDGGALAFADANRAILLRALATGIERRLASPAGEVLHLAFSPDGLSLATVRGQRVEVLDVASGRAIWQDTNAATVAEPAWSHDGALLAFASGAANDIVLVRVDDGVRAGLLRAHGLAPRWLAFHPEDRLLASAGQDRLLRLWDVASGAELVQASAAPRVLRFSNDGRRLAFAPEHLGCALFDLTGSEVWRELLGRPGGAPRASVPRLSASGRWIASVDAQEARLWDTSAGREVAALPLGADSSARALVTADGREWILGSRASGFARYRLPSDDPVNPAKMEPGEALDGARKVAVFELGPGGRQWVVERTEEKQILLWPEGRRDRERVLTTVERLHGACFSPDNRWLCLLTGPAPGVSVWDVAAGRKAADLPFRRHADAQFSPDGRWLLTGTDAEYQLWSAGAWQPDRAWPSELGGRNAGAIAYSPDGRYVALALGANSLQLRDGRDYAELVRLEPPMALSLEALGWSPDSTRLYVHQAGHRVCYWSLPELRGELAKLGLDWAEPRLYSSRPSER